LKIKIRPKAPRKLKTKQLQPEQKQQDVRQQVARHDNYGKLLQEYEIAQQTMQLQQQQQQLVQQQQQQQQEEVDFTSLFNGI